MLNLYRRHLTACPHASDRFYRRCACPMWIIGVDPRGAYHRRTLNTTSWATAESLRRQIEAGDDPHANVEIAAALDAWTDALRAAKRGERTVKQVHGAMARSLKLWCADKGYARLRQLTLPVLDVFVSSWSYASTTHRSRIDLMRQFFKFCTARKWITENPAKGLIKPPDDQDPTLPFTVAEETAIFAAAARFREHRPDSESIWAIHAESARALLYVLRYTGLRISDAVLFEPREMSTVDIDGRSVDVYATYQAKTGDHVFCPIPPNAAAIIRAAPRMSDRAFIPDPKSGHSTELRHVANSYYEGYLCRLGALSGVAGVRAHRFRDTFAVRLLEAGKPLEIVQALLGHRSINTTDKHYAPWVRSRAEMLIREVAGMWH